ncbi:MAG: hypothetical protein KBC36_12795 [Spirochaetia bacterium]|nr:hypothetical protein [Spirochaetia bacterium]
MQKRIVFAIIGLAALVGIVAAQGFAPMMGRGGYPYAAPAAPAAAATAAKTLEGKLQIVDGVAALVVKDLTYILHFPGFFRTAYVEEIKVGTTIKVEGSEYPAPAGQTRPIFAATKLTVGSKTFDLATQFQGRGAFGAYGAMPYGGMMGGRGGRGGRW